MSKRKLSTATEFQKANDLSKVVSGAAWGPGGGGTYTLDNGKVFHMSVEEMRKLPEGYPNWGFGDVV